MFIRLFCKSVYFFNIVECVCVYMNNTGCNFAIFPLVGPCTY